jgi:hypothetical protein
MNPFKAKPQASKGNYAPNKTSLSKYGMAGLQYASHE